MHRQLLFNIVASQVCERLEHMWTFSPIESYIDGGSYILGGMYKAMVVTSSHHIVSGPTSQMMSSFTSTDKEGHWTNILMTNWEDNANSLFGKASLM